jgi:hypothetical protein
MDHVTIFLLGLCPNIIFELLFPVLSGLPGAVLVNEM